MEKSNEATVCPESTIESAIRENARRNTNAIISDRSTGLVCESTIESASRRNLLRRAAAVAAIGAVGVMGVKSLDKIIIPSSDASSSGCGGDLILGSSNSASNTTQLISCYTSCHNYGSFTVFNHGGSGRAMVGYATCTGGIGLAGIAGTSLACYENDGTNGNGVYGTTKSGYGVVGRSYTGCGVFGQSHSGNGVLGCGATGVHGYGTSCGVSGIGPTGVYGHGCIVGVQGSGLTGVSGHGCSFGVQGSGLIGVSGCGSTFGVQGCSHGTGVHGHGCNAGVSGCGSTTGVYGHGSTVGVQGSGLIGVSGCGICTGVYGRGCTFGIGGFGSIGVSGCGSTVGVQALATTATAIPFVAIGATSQSANLMQFEKNCGKTLSVVNKCGWIGINTCKPQTTLQVKGGMSLNYKCAGTTATCVTMKTSCFALFAPKSGQNITLPAAKNGGMIVFIKNTSTGNVTVKGAGTDTIEGSSTYALATKAGVTLVANGKSSGGTWYIISTST